MDHYQEHCDFHYDSLLAHCEHQAIIDACDRGNTHSAWLSTDLDTWVRNPFYTGTDFRHPEAVREDRD